MEKTFKNICKRDIGEILKMVNEYLPSLEKWHLEQSAIFGENKRIICKSVKDKNNNRLGYDIRIHVNDNENSFFHFRYTDNAIFLIKKVWIDEEFSIWNISISLISNELIRKLSYKNENGIVLHEESYNINNDTDLQSYFDTESLDSIVNALEDKCKVRKRN